MLNLTSLSGAIILKIVYGYERAQHFMLIFGLPSSSQNYRAVDPENDSFVNLADEALQWLSKCAVPGSYRVDFFPFSKPAINDVVLPSSWNISKTRTGLVF